MLKYNLFWAANNLGIRVVDKVYYQQRIDKWCN